MRYLISICYDGSKFYGFQRLKGKKSIQDEIEKALKKINKSEVIIKGAGRTDRGVHALDQKAHFDLSINIEPDRLVNAINSLVEPYIRITNAMYVNEDFHARFDVLEKTYTYKINMGEYDPIRNDYLYNYNRKLNVSAMKKASKFLIGAHSFKAFTSGERDNYNSIINSIKFKKDDNILSITFKGKSFYRYMVRNLVGALLLVGSNKEDYKVIQEMLESGYNKYNYMTVPASGLYLEKIDY